MCFSSPEVTETFRLGERGYPRLPPRMAEDVSSLPRLTCKKTNPKHTEKGPKISGSGSAFGCRLCVYFLWHTRAGVVTLVQLHKTRKMPPICQSARPGSLRSFVRRACTLRWPKGKSQTRVDILKVVHVGQNMARSLSSS